MQILEKTYALLEDRIEHCKQVKNYIKRLQKVKNQRVMVEGSYDIQLTNWRRCKRIINNIQDNTCENRDEDLTFLKTTFLEDITKMKESCQKGIDKLSTSEKTEQDPVNQENKETLLPKLEQSLKDLEETYQELYNFN